MLIHGSSSCSNNRLIMLSRGLNIKADEYMDLKRIIFDGPPVMENESSCIVDQVV